MRKVLFLLILSACVGSEYVMPDVFTFVPVDTDTYTIATWQKIKNPALKKIHIYIEGDGNAFDVHGLPTQNPTPHGTFLRDLACQDNFENVVYIARPCQFIMTSSCDVSDWTSGRFSQKIIDAQSKVITQIARNKNITMIGYSGGAMISGLVITQNPQLKIEKWITIAGVLNHTKWAQYFGDKKLTESLDMDKLPNIKQIHFIGGRDEIVPYELAKTWAQPKDIKLIPDATHDDFGILKIFD